MFNLEEVLKNFKGKHYIPNDDNEVDYKQLYEQQKQRADELEKRWSELKSLVVDKAHFYENKGYMHQGAILVDVVEEMEQLEKENDNA